MAEHVRKSNFSGRAERDELDFIPDFDIPSDAIASSSDYASSGFDKGHMAPAANFKSSQAAMNATFRFANAVPQTPQSNRGIWKKLEDATRELAIRRGDLYVVTGPIFFGSTRKKLNHRVSIPDATYKILFDPKRNSMTGFFIPNNSVAVPIKHIIAGHIQNVTDRLDAEAGASEGMDCTTAQLLTGCRIAERDIDKEQQVLISEALVEVRAPQSAFEEGMLDAARGLHFNANPHPNGTDEADQRNEGWLAGSDGNFDEMEH